MKPMTKRLTSEEFKSIYSRVPRLTVEVCIKTEKGIVLTKRDIEPWKGYWHIPGGTVSMYETLEDAVKRVALYEAGVEVEVKELMGYILYPSIKEHGDPGWPVGIAFLATIKSGVLRGSDQGMEIREFVESPGKIIPEQLVFIEQNNLFNIT
jgi:ADP-ribose pyrophosphatase YjhB (NUDIX family)